MKELVPETVHSGRFAAFGELLNDTSGTPLADSEEMTYWGGITKFDFPPKLSSGFLKSRHTNTVITQLERHTETAEILVALSSDVVICMATPDSRVGSEDVELGAFLMRQGEAIRMYAGTWHWLPVPVDTSEAHFLVLFADKTESDDLEVVELSEPVKVKKP